MPWTDEMIESLKKMWDEGLSTGEIGKRLGVSKNSIVGKVHRLKLSGRPSPIKKKDDTVSTPKKTKLTEKPATKPEENSSPKQEVHTPVAPAKTATPMATPNKHATNGSNTTAAAKSVTPPTSLKETKEKDLDAFINVSIPSVSKPKKPGDKVTVTDLDNHTCRWPIGDPKDENFHFCGAAVRVGQTYCEEHAAIAYVKTLKK